MAKGNKLSETENGKGTNRQQASSKVPKPRAVQAVDVDKLVTPNHRNQPRNRHGESNDGQDKPGNEGPQ